MPLYEYECPKCGTRFEKIQKFSDPPLTTCEKCGGRLKKLVSASTIQFKGSGWYVTDYAGKSSGEPKPAVTSDDKSKPAEAKEAKKPAETSVKKDS